MANPERELGVADKLRLMERLWDELCDNPEDVPSPAWHSDVLRKREQDVAEGRQVPMDWDEAKREIRRRLS